jgi:hypothetical protein
MVVSSNVLSGTSYQMVNSSGQLIGPDYVSPAPQFIPPAGMMQGSTTFTPPSGMQQMP